MDISIKKPCHENWDNMTPNEQGAFCHACVKNVIDFSEKTIEEIKAFFTTKKDKERVCGRFTTEQIIDLSFDSFFARFRKFSFVRKMAIVVFFTFGFALFGTEPAQAQTMHLKGDVAYEEPVLKKGKVKVVKDTVCTVTNEMKPLKGKVEFHQSNQQPKRGTGRPKQSTQPATPKRKGQDPPSKNSEVIIPNKEN